MLTATVQPLPLDDFTNANLDEVLAEIVESNPRAAKGTIEARYLHQVSSSPVLLMKALSDDFARRFVRVTKTKKPKTKGHATVEAAMAGLPEPLGEQMTLFGTPVIHTPHENQGRLEGFHGRLRRRTLPGQTPAEAGLTEAELRMLMAATA